MAKRCRRWTQVFTHPTRMDSRIAKCERMRGGGVKCETLTTRGKPDNAFVGGTWTNVRKAVEKAMRRDGFTGPKTGWACRGR
jgi:D-alanyl-D-alanine dipeptidase